MNKIIFGQRIKLLIQQTFSFKTALFITAFICIGLRLLQVNYYEVFNFNDFIYAFTNNISLSYILFIVLLYLLILFIQIVIHVNNMKYLFVKDLYVIPGKIIKAYRDRVPDGNFPHDYNSRQISMFSNNVITVRKRISIGAVFRAKAQSDDGKFTTLWVDIPKKVAKNRDKFIANVVVYNNEAITFIYERK